MPSVTFLIITLLLGPGGVLLETNRALCESGEKTVPAQAPIYSMRLNCIKLILKAFSFLTLNCASLVCWALTVKAARIKKKAATKIARNLIDPFPVKYLACFISLYL